MFASRFFTRGCVALLVLMLTCLSSAFATPVIWTLSGVTFNDGGSASGYLVYDADTGVISTWSIKTAGGNTAAMPPFTYISTLPNTPTLSPLGNYDTGSPYLGPMFATFNPSSHFTIRALQLPVASGLTNAGGTVAIDTANFFAYECINCSPYRRVNAGNLVSISGTAPSITSANAATFAVGTAGTFTVTTTGNPAPTLSESGTLPSGVTFTDNGDGTATLAGTPAAGSGGTYTLNLTANNGASPNATQSFTLTVDYAPAITSANATTFAVGTAASFTVTTSGIPAASLSESGTLPTGVTFVDNGNGTATLSGTPAAGSGGTYPLTLTANNGVSPNATQNFNLTVNANQAPAITSANATTFVVGTAGTFTVTTSGTPTPTLSASGALPSGVIIVDNGNGTATLSGMPAAGSGGTYALTLTASNGVAPNATQGFTLSVNEAPAITSAAGAHFVTNALSTFTVTTSGFPAATLSEVGALPAGVTFTDNGNGTATLSGTPSVAGVYVVTISANNGVAPAAAQTFTLQVAAPAMAPMLDTAGLLALVLLLVAIASFGLRQKRLMP